MGLFKVRSQPSTNDLYTAMQCHHYFYILETRCVWKLEKRIARIPGKPGYPVPCNRSFMDCSAGMDLSQASMPVQSPQCLVDLVTRAGKILVFEVQCV